MKIDKSLLAADGQFACPTCRGNKTVNFGGLAEARMCPGCLGTGHLVDYLVFCVQCEKSNYDRVSERHMELVAWVKKTSSCKTCGGDSHKTMGGIPCAECGLTGTMPWGG